MLRSGRLGVILLFILRYLCYLLFQSIADLRFKERFGLRILCAIMHRVCKQTHSSRRASVVLSS
jgi:hypothetical protein